MLTTKSDFRGGQAMYYAAQQKQSLYDKLGGEDGIRALGEEFNDIV